MNTIDRETLIKLLVAQCRSADLWVRCWKQNQDVSSMRNAAMAIGKIHGIYNVLVFMIKGDENLPEQIIGLVHEYQAVWDSLHIPQSA